MTDALDAMDKDQLAELASVRGVDVDGRWSAQRLREAIRSDMATEAANVSIASEALATDMATFEEPVVTGIVANDLDSVAWEWAKAFCADLERISATVDDGVMTVVIRTAHGVTEETETGASVDEMLAAIKARIMGEQAD